MRLGLLLAFLLLAPTAGLAGCLQTLQGKLSDVQSDPAAPEPYVATFEDAVAPSHSKSYKFPVEEGAIGARADVSLAMLAEGQDLPIALAQVTIGFRDPANAPVGEARTVDPRSPTATILLDAFTTFGEYRLVVTGNGLSGPPGGARYNATIAVSY